MKPPYFAGSPASGPRRDYLETLCLKSLDRSREMPPLTDQINSFDAFVS